MTGAKRRALTLGNACHLLQCIDWRYSNQSDASSKVRGLDMALFPAQSLIREVGLRAIEARADLLLAPLSASHAHSLANLHKTPDEVVAEVARIRAERDASGSRTLIEGGIGTAFGCTLQGAVAPTEVLRCMQALLDAGADRVSMADTVGYADPAAVHRLFEKARRIA
jgi:isopropylmalate/homocitrate/citramalate synthase